MRALLAAMIASGLLLAGCSSPPSDDPSDDAGSSNPAGSSQPTGAGGAPNGAPPQMHVGDHWRHKSSGGGVNATSDMRIAAIEDRDGESAYRLEGTVKTDVGGSETTGESTSWTRVNDHAVMETVSTAHIAFGGQSYESTTTTVHDPPCVMLRWGLSVGATWTATCTSTTTSSSGGGPQTTTTTTTFTVEAEESVTVEAGTFDAFRIRVDSGDQSHKQWVSEEACGMVKSEATAQGQAITTELVDYEC